VPPPPPPPPPGFGINVIGHHDWLNSFQKWEEFVLGDVIADPAVIAAVKEIRAAASTADRVAAVNKLMGRIG
jgi:hypothetical protein